MAIQDIVVIASWMKPVITPRYLEVGELPRRKGNGVASWKLTN